MFEKYGRQSLLEKPEILRFTAPVSGFERFSFLSCSYRIGSFVCCAIAGPRSVVLANAEPVKARRVILNLSDMINGSVYIGLHSKYFFMAAVSIQRTVNWCNLADRDSKIIAMLSRAAYRNVVDPLIWGHTP